MWCRSPSSSKDDDRELEGTAVEVFVGGLPPDTKEEEVQQAFSAVGQVTGLRLNRRKRTGECKGFGFVRYTDQATAEKACFEVREVRSVLCKLCSCQCWLKLFTILSVEGSYWLLWLSEICFTRLLQHSSFFAGLWQASGCAHIPWPYC